MVYGKSVRTSRWQKDTTSFFCVVIAALIMSTNIKSFVRAGDLIPGGFTGLSLLLQRIFIQFYNIEIPYSVINISLNAIPAFIGYRIIGKKFTMYTILLIVLNLSH